jgi:hypothetical protein
MIARPNILPSALTIAAALMVLFETVCFGSLQPGYSHISKTISELGETGALHAHSVAFGFFFPVGVLVWLALWLVHRQAPEREASFILAALSCLGTGYALSAFFPCDPGGPLFGTWRTLVHNILGFIDYAGTGFGFLLTARYLKGPSAATQANFFLIAGALMFIGVGLLSAEGMFHIRGAVQRLTEVIQFGGVFFACCFLPQCRNRRWEVLTK